MKKSTREIVAANLKRLMDSSTNLRTQAQVSARSGVGQTTIGRILRAEVDARSDSLAALARAFGKSDYDLLRSDITNVEDIASEAHSQREAPVISWVQAGEWQQVEDQYHPGEADHWEPVPTNTGSHAFWLRVRGDSMENPGGKMSVPEGALILVEPDKEAVPGNLVIAKLTDSGEVTFKRWVNDAGREYLMAINPSYPPVEINGNCEIIGPVYEYKVKL